MWNVIGLVVAGYLVLVGGMYIFQRGLLYHPDRETPSPAEWGAPQMTAVQVPTADGLTLLAWWKAPAENRPTIVHFHGNAGHIGNRASKVLPLMEAGFGMLLAEYRGYGGNPGRPSEKGLLTDGRAALDYLAGIGVAPDRVVIYGESLGSGIAVAMAREWADSGRPLRAVVLEAPFTSVADVAQHHYPYVPALYLVRDRFDSLSRIDGITAPLFIVHGDRDTVVPVRLGRRLFAAAKEPKTDLWIESAGHNDLYDHGADRAIAAFLDRLP